MSLEIGLQNTITTDVQYPENEVDKTYKKDDNRSKLGAILIGLRNKS